MTTATNTNTNMEKAMNSYRASCNYFTEEEIELVDAEHEYIYGRSGTKLVIPLGRFRLLQETEAYYSWDAVHYSNIIPPGIYRIAFHGSPATPVKIVTAD